MNRRNLLKTVAATSVATLATSAGLPAASPPGGLEGGLPEIYPHPIPLLHPGTLLRRVAAVAKNFPDATMRYQFIDICGLQRACIPGVHEASAEALLRMARWTGMPDELLVHDAFQVDPDVRLHYLDYGRNIQPLTFPGDQNMYWLYGERYASFYYELPGGRRFVFKIGSKDPGSPEDPTPDWQGVDTFHITGTLPWLTMDGVVALRG